MQQVTLIAIETSTAACSVALSHNGQIIEEFVVAPRKHTELFLPMVANLLSKANLDFSNLQAIAYSAGPGSFTGLRLTASITQAFALAHDLPVIPVSSLQVIAQGAYRVYQAEHILIFNDARIKQAYFGHYVWDSNQCALQAQQKDTLIQSDDIPSLIEKAQNSKIPVLIVGDLVEPLSLSNGDNVQVVTEPIWPHACDLASIAVLDYAKGGMCSPDQALPTYMQQTDYKKA